MYSSQILYLYYSKSIFIAKNIFNYFNKIDNYNVKYFEIQEL